MGKPRTPAQLAQIKDFKDKALVFLDHEGQPRHIQQIRDHLGLSDSLLEVRALEAALKEAREVDHRVEQVAGRKGMWRSVKPGQQPLPVGQPAPGVLDNIRGILADVAFPAYRFHVGPLAEGAYLQVVYDEPDIESGQPGEQRGRKWYVSPHAVRSEIVQTAFKAVMTSAEHRVREHFTYKGARIFGPHFDLDGLVALCGRGATERRS